MPETKKKKSENSWGFLPSLVGSLATTVENFVHSFLNTAEVAAQDLLRKSIEKLVSFFLIAVGTLFLAVGVAAFLSDYFRVAGAGPLIVGGAFLIVGLFFILSRRD